MDFFGLLAPLFDHAPAISADSPLVRLTELPARGSLLDAGGGTGRAGRTFSAQAGRVVVADPSPGMIRRAAENGLLAVLAEAEALPFSDGTFDRVIMVDAFHHVRRQDAAAVEMVRVTQPGGRVVVQEPNPETFAMKVMAVIEKLMLMRSHLRTGEVIGRMLGQAGASIQVHKEGLEAWIVADKRA